MADDWYWDSGTPLDLSQYDTTGYDFFKDGYLGPVGNYSDWLSNSYNGIDNGSGSGFGGLLSSAGSALLSKIAANPGAAAALLGGGLLGNLSGAKQTGEQTVKSVPWDLQQPYLIDLFNKAKDQAGQGSTPSAYETQAAGAYAQGNPLAGQAQGVIGRTLGANPNQMYGQDWLNPYATQRNAYSGANPYLEQSINKTLGDVSSRVNSQFSGTNYGTTAHQETLGRALGDTSSAMRMQDYGMQQGLDENRLNRGMQGYEAMYGRNIGQNQFGQNMVNNAAYNVPQFWNASLEPNKTLFQMGNQMRQTPWDNINNYRGAIYGDYGKTQTTPTYSNPLGQTLGGAAMGAGIYSQLFGNKSGG